MGTAVRICVHGELLKPAILADIKTNKDWRNDRMNEAMEALKMQLKNYVESITKPSPKAGANHYICPLCGSGSGEHGTGAFSLYSNEAKWKCFACGNGGDVYDLVRLVEGITTLREQTERLSAFAGGQPLQEAAKAQKKAPANSDQEQERRREYIALCQRNVSKTTYFKDRGLSLEAIKDFRLGYDEERRLAILPYPNTDYYITRKTENNGSTDRYFKLKGIPEPLYNAEALADEKPCFICEGQLDAISIMDAFPAVNAIALGGIGTRNLIANIKEKRFNRPLILALDNDDTGREKSLSIADELQSLGLFILQAEWTNSELKDPNDMLKENRETFRNDIKLNFSKAVNRYQTELKPQPKETPWRAGNDVLEKLLEDLKNGRGGECIPTGFQELDEYLDGGLYPGLYIMGAISSMGKTTLMLQMANNIAEQGRPVLYFSLEMSAEELTAKSLSRLSLEMCEGFEGAAQAARTFMNPARYETFNIHADKTIKAIYEKVLARYAQISMNFYIVPRSGEMNIDTIKQIIKQFQEDTGRTPLIFVDYLQIIPGKPGLTDKQSTDKNVTDLKVLSAELDTVVFAISSFNRSNYNTSATMAAFKESGGIEYSADVLLALQPLGMGKGKTNEKEKNDPIEEYKKAEQRDAGLVVLKNRNGKTGSEIPLIYVPACNWFGSRDDVPGDAYNPYIQQSMQLDNETLLS